MTTVDVVLVVARLLVGLWLLWSVPLLARRARPAPLEGVSVVVPARDEARTLPRLLASIPDDVEVVVVDDESSDDTAVRAAIAGARVVESAPRPAGWTGKAWACAQGAAAAGGEVLVFVDADVRFGPGALDAVVDRVRAAGGLLSIQPHHEPGRPVEHLAAVFNVVGFAGTDAASPLGHRRGARGAFGPVLATTRHDYDAVGGHEVARASVVDDVALAQAYRRTDRPVEIRAGGELVAFRMYPEGLHPLLEGFTKNLAAGAGAVRRLTTVLVAAWLSLLVQAAVTPVRAVFVHGGIADAGLVWPAALYVVVAVEFWWMARRVGRFHPLVAVLFPVSVVLFLVVFVASLVATARGSVSWRGRRVPTR